MRAGLSRQAVLLGCAKGYVARGKLGPALEELQELERCYGFSEESIELTVSLLVAQEHWYYLGTYTRKVLVSHAWMHAAGWFGQIRSARKRKDWHESTYLIGLATPRYPRDVRIVAECARVYCAREAYIDAGIYMSTLCDLDPEAYQSCRQDADLAGYFAWLDSFLADATS